MTRSSFGTTRFVAAAALALLLAVALLAIGCSSSSQSSSTTAGSGANTTATGSTGSSAGKTGTTVAGATGSTQAATGTSAAQRLAVGTKTDAEYKAEIPKLQATLKSNPNDLASLQELAVAQYNLRQLPDAAATYQKMLAVKDDPTTHNNYGNVLRVEGNAAGALAEYQKAIAGDKTLTVAYVNLATIYAGQKKLDEAKKIVQQGIAATTGADQTSLKAYLAQLNATK